tara:strand:- start:9604 stop:11136 length:1533 start_codon:yes stop_codon:yes gene_type:complete
MNTFKLLQDDIIDKDYTVVKESPWRTTSIAAILKLDNMYGKEGKKMLYKCIPYNKHLPICLVPYEEKQGFSKKRVHKYVLVTFKHWRDKHPVVTLIQTFGDIDNLSCLYDYLLFGLNIHSSNQRFTKAFTLAYKETTNTLHIENMRKRYALEDRTSHQVITIDGDTTKDFDDGIGYVTNTDEDILTIYISNTVLWMDYLNLWKDYGDRTSSIYLPDRVVNMLPNKMGNSVAGLVEKELSVAFAMDLHLRDNKIKSVRFHNVIIQVDRNFRYEEPELLGSNFYRSILSKMEDLDMNVENSYKFIEKWMIYFNSKIGETLSRYKKGIYRYCRIEDSVEQKVPSDLQQYMQWQDTHSGYALHGPDVVHSILGIPYYTQMSSPIRRIVDMINMIEIHLMLDLCKLSQDTIAYKDKWLTKLDTINNTHRAIKQLESQTKLLNYYSNTPDADTQVHEAYVVSILEEYKYKLYVPSLQTTGVLKVIEVLPLYIKINCTLCLIQDDINIVQKIRFVKV